MHNNLYVHIKKIDPDATIPGYAHGGDAGMDLTSIEEVTVWPGERATVRTGIAIDIPYGYVGLIHPRSGMAFKCGITVLNTPGTIDSGYRGEIKVCLFNATSRDPYTVYPGHRIAQIVFQPIMLGVFQEVWDLSDSVRHDNGFGSTGV